MLVNFSTSNDTDLQSNLSCTKHCEHSMQCFTVGPGIMVYTAFFIAALLLQLPLCILVLFLGHQRWRQHHTMCHSDSFTYHFAFMKLFGIAGYTVFFCGLRQTHISLLIRGFCMWNFAWYGETVLHLLTCVERYLAVVHPITYMGLKGERGIRFRNITIGCVWFICSGRMWLLLSEKVSEIMDLVLMCFCLLIISFLNFSILLILIRPGPGEQPRDRDRLDPSKQRAFYTIMTILGVLLMRFSWNMFWSVHDFITQSCECFIVVSGIWLDFPSSLILPLLFLHRVGTCVCCVKPTNT